MRVGTNARVATQGLGKYLEHAFQRGVGNQRMNADAIFWMVHLVFLNAYALRLLPMVYHHLPAEPTTMELMLLLVHHLDCIAVGLIICM